MIERQERERERERKRLCDRVGGEKEQLRELEYYMLSFGKRIVGRGELKKPPSCSLGKYQEIQT